MLDWGFVQFYGQDIDQTCVQMAQINMMLHGLNGYSMKCAVAVGEINTSDTAENLIGIPTEIFEQHLTEMEV
jgi:type I restriction-modification system DNA methylase subunit